MEALDNDSIDDGEVDFDNEIIRDPSFNGTKADCVLSSLISSGNNLFKSTSKAFTGNLSKFKIKFTTYNDPIDVADAHTALPDSNGIIEIRINLANNANSRAINIASILLHETIHDELHRIKLTNNSGPNPLPTPQYNWYVKIWNAFATYYGNPPETAGAAEHNYMAFYLINNIAQGIRDFDDNTHPLANYKYFAWTGLQYYGKQNGYVTQSDLNAMANLAIIVNNDNHPNPCD